MVIYLHGIWRHGVALLCDVGGWRGGMYMDMVHGYWVDDDDCDFFLGLA